MHSGHGIAGKWQNTCGETDVHQESNADDVMDFCEAKRKYPLLLGGFLSVTTTSENVQREGLRRIECVESEGEDRSRGGTHTNNRESR